MRFPKKSFLGENPFLGENTFLEEKTFSEEKSPVTGRRKMRLPQI
jgi:hypothetical protein